MNQNLNIPDDWVLMRYDVSAVHVKQHGPGYRPFDGKLAWVHPDGVQDRRDKGWQLVRQ